MFVAIRYYQAAPDSIDEVVSRVKEGFVPIIRDTQGFVSYFVLAPSEREDELVSVSVFEDRSGAEESNERAEDWVKENLSELLPLPEVAAGEVVVYESK
jgi:heme-degrading monooxygenase HmoA